MYPEPPWRPHSRFAFLLYEDVDVYDSIMLQASQFYKYSPMGSSCIVSKNGSSASFVIHDWRINRPRMSWPSPRFLQRYRCCYCEGGPALGKKRSDKIAINHRAGLLGPQRHRLRCIHPGGRPICTRQYLFIDSNLDHNQLS